MSHLTQIPEAVRIAAADSGAQPELKQQAIDYLGKVKELSEETYQDCLSLYLQGAGASAPGQVGQDGKEKLSTELRMFCEQVFEAALIQKSENISPESLQAMYNALVSFVSTEWVNGARESGQSFLRNKLSFDLAHLFIDAYPTHIPSFLHPFFPLLQSDHPDPVYLVIHLFNEIALEIHDSTIRSARPFSQTRFVRDGNIRDSIRQSGDEASAVQGMLGVAQRAIDQGGKWLDVGELAMKTLATWTPWVELTVSLNPQTLAFYRQLLSHPSLRVAAAGILRTLVGKGIKDPSEKMQIMKVLDVLSTIEPLMSTDDINFKVALGSVLAVYGTELVEMWDNDEYPEHVRKEAESMIDAARPLLLRFMADAHHEVPNSASPFVRDLLSIYKRLHVPKSAVLRPGKNQVPSPSVPVQELPAERRAFLAELLDVSVRQLAWPADAEWEAPSDDPDPEDDLAMLQAKRVQCRSYIESISQIEKALHTEVVANIVVMTLEAVKSGQQVPWQQAELAVHLVYTFGELSKNNTRAAFFELPTELATKAARDRTQRIALNKTHLSGRITPDMTDDQLAEPITGLHYPKGDRVDYDTYALTPLGHLLALCVESDIVSYPHPSVTLQFFEAVVRYVEFFRSKPKTIKPMFEAMLDARGIHHPDEAVRRRCFYLFGKFVRDCKNDVEPSMIPVILDSIKDLLVINIEPLEQVPDEDPLIKATTGKSYFMDQLYLFEAAGALVYVTRSDANRQIPLLQAVAGPLMQGLGAALRVNTPEAVLSVHHHLLALGNFAKGFPIVGEDQLETLPYQAPFKQMTEALLEALEAMKTQRVVRDSARFAFSQFVNAIGTTVAELVPQFVQKVVTEFEPAELIDFMTFLGLLIHRLKRNTFETMDMLLLPLLSRIFAVLQQPITGTDDASMHRKLKESYLTFFIALMNANLDAVFISERNKPEFENVLTAVLAQTSDNSDQTCQRLAFGFFGKSVIAWATSGVHADAFAESALSDKSKNVANGLGGATNQHAIPREERAGMRLEGYENFVYQRLVPACFEVPASPQFNLRSNQPVILEMAMLLRNTLQARGVEMVDFLKGDLLPKMNCPQNYADELIKQMRTQQARDFKKTYGDFLKAVKGK